MKFSTLLGAASLTAIASVAAAQDSDFLVFDYPGFEDPAFHTSYVEKNGDSPAFSFFGDEEEAFQKLRSGFRADVAHICAGSVTKWTESGIIEPWDTTRIAEFANLDGNLLGTDVAGDQAYFIPTDFGATAIAYNPDEVTAEQVSSLNVFVDPAFAGRVTIPDNVDDAYALAYLATGVTDWTSATDEQFEAASAWLRQAHENMRTYWTDPAELSQLLSSGEVTVAWAWNETYPTMVEEGRPIAYQREAAEGSSLWLCGYVNLTDGEGPEDKAYDYINAILAPASTMPLLESGFGHSNAASMAGVDAAELDAAGLGAIDAPVLAQVPTSNEQRERQSEAFERIKAGF